MGITRFWVLDFWSGSEVLINSLTCYSHFLALTHSSPGEVRAIFKALMLGKPWLTVARVLLGMRSDISPILGKLLLEQIQLVFREGKETSLQKTQRDDIAFSLVSGRFHAFRLGTHEAQLWLPPLCLVRHVHYTHLKTSSRHIIQPWSSKVLLLSLRGGDGASGVGKGRNNTEAMMTCSGPQAQSLSLVSRESFAPLSPLLSSLSPHWHQFHHSCPDNFA